MLGFFVVRRYRRAVNGARASATRFVTSVLIYTLIGAGALYESYLIGTPQTYFVVFALAALASYIASLKLMSTRLVYWRTPEGRLYYKGGALLILVYAILLVVRVTLEYFYLGGAPGVTASPVEVEASALVDLLLMVSMGLLLGRNTLVFLEKVRGGPHAIEAPGAHPGQSVDQSFTAAAI